MTVTVAVMKPVPGHDIDEVEGEFELQDAAIKMIDELIGTDLGDDRAEVIHSIIIFQLRRWQAFMQEQGYRVGDVHPTAGINT